MTDGRIVVVMPAYNEAAGIGGFLVEISHHLSSRAEHLEIIVADDRSSDSTASVVDAVAGARVVTQRHNRGHGPTALAAYRAGLEAGADLIVHVDGDGQFSGHDIGRAVDAAQRTGVDVVHGVRRHRTDPWYRRALTACLRAAVTVATGRAIPDINTPLRVYRPEALEILIDAVDPDAEVPHVHFSLAESRGGFSVRYIEVASLPRRGGIEAGTMWGAAASLFPPKRLRRFVGRALAELWTASLRPGARMRSVTRRPATASSPSVP